jgi:hypothetical protein
MTTKDLINAYYSAFNSRDIESFLSLLTEDVAHDINQGKRENGKVSRVSNHYNLQDWIDQVSR